MQSTFSRPWQLFGFFFGQLLLVAIGVFIAGTCLAALWAIGQGCVYAWSQLGFGAFAPSAAFWQGLGLVAVAGALLCVAREAVVMQCTAAAQQGAAQLEAGQPLALPARHDVLSRAIALGAACAAAGAVLRFVSLTGWDLPLFAVGAAGALGSAFLYRLSLRQLDEQREMCAYMFQPAVRAPGL